MKSNIVISYVVYTMFCVVKRLRLNIETSELRLRKINFTVRGEINLPSDYFINFVSLDRKSVK